MVGKFVINVGIFDVAVVWGNGRVTIVNCELVGIVGSVDANVNRAEKKNYF